jgi:hypothetical protein
MFSKLHSLCLTLCFGLFAMLPFLLKGNVKETHKIIDEWVQTELLLSEEASKWREEKAALLDLQKALESEIAQLDEGLQSFEKEETTLEQERAKLNSRKLTSEEKTRALLIGLQKLESEIEKVFKILPVPLRERLTPFREKLIKAQTGQDLPMRKRLELSLSLLQAVHSFNRTVTIERLEFTLDDNKSREFLVLYFGLGVAYFVNESATVAGYGQPESEGWKWIRMDELAGEISEGIDIMNNRALPRFLSLPIPMPEASAR